MKTKALLLLSLFIISACNDYGFINKNIVPTAPTIPAPDQVPLTGPNLKTWQESVPADFKNLQDGQVNFHVAMNSSGSTVMAWEIHNGYTRSLYLSHLKNSVWSHPVMDEPFNLDINGYAQIQKVLVNEAGEIKIIYKEGHHIYLYEYKNNQWISPIVIGTSTTNFYISKVATTPNGKILIVSVFGNKLASVYFNGTSWVDHGELKYQDSQSVAVANYDLGLALAESGKAILAFNHYKSDYTYATHRAEFDGNNWTMPANENAQMGAGYVTKVAMNPSGKAVFLWQTLDDVVHLQENNGSGWEAEYTFNPGTWITVDTIELFVSSSGVVRGFWAYNNILSVYKKSGTSFVVDQSFPAYANSFQIRKSNDDSIAYAWSTPSEVFYVLCNFTSCQSAQKVSEQEMDINNNPVPKRLTRLEFSGDKVIILWDRGSWATDGKYIEETGGVEESSEWPIYDLTPIHYKTDYLPT